MKAKTLRHILQEMGMMEQVLARKLGITKSALSRKINGSRPWTEAQIKLVCHIVGRSPEEVFPPTEMAQEIT